MRLGEIKNFPQKKESGICGECGGNWNRLDYDEIADLEIVCDVEKLAEILYYADRFEPWQSYDQAVPFIKQGYIEKARRLNSTLPQWLILKDNAE